MENTIVIHVKSGIADIANNPGEQSIVVINFDKYATLPNMGDPNKLIECPKCQHHGSQFEWNVATCDDFCDNHNTDFTRIQNAKSGFYFTCAYCCETSTTEELGLIPFEITVAPPAPLKYIGRKFQLPLRRLLNIPSGSQQESQLQNCGQS